MLDIRVNKAFTPAMNHMQNQPPMKWASSKGKFLSRTCFSLVCFWGLSLFQAHAQAPSALYTWAGTGNVQDWAKNFGANTVVLDNNTAGELHITETGGAGADVAISDGGNRVRESSVGAQGGLDLTGLAYLEFDLGHNGAGNINVQFFIQGSPSYAYVALGPDLAVSPGVNTYQVPLSSLTPEQAIYIRTIGFNARSHAAVGDVVWTLREVRAGGTPLKTRDLVTFDTGTADGGLQGAIVNFDGAGVLGNSGQDQTGLSQNPAGSGSLQWTDVGGGPGGGISWGNGTAWNGNTFYSRLTDLSNYATMVIRMSAAEVNPGAGGSLNVQAFFQVNGFATYQSPGTLSLPLDGQFHELTYSLAGMVSMNVVDQTGINLASHATDLLINVDNVRFEIAPLQIKSIQTSGQNITLKFSTSVGQTYSVEYSTDLSPGSFTNAVGGTILVDAQDATVTDANAVTAASARYYRVTLL